MQSTRQRILLVGASGVIGRWVHQALDGEHEVITAGLANAQIRLDLSQTASIHAALKQADELDAIVYTAGRAHFAPLHSIEAADGEASRYALGLQDKLMGQVNLALASRGVLRRGGSITLTSGTTSDDPILGGSSLSMVNGALEAWVRAAATEWTDDVRINLVSPSLVEGTPAQAMKAFPGIAVVSGKQVALAYLRCLFSGIRGQTLRI